MKSMFIVRKTIRYPTAPKGSGNGLELFSTSVFSVSSVVRISVGATGFEPAVRE
jgi:hypothetical protein